MKTEPRRIPPDSARYWARKLGCDESSLTRLQGGINNQVYQCGMNNEWVIKTYRSIDGSQRDGLAAEIDFLRYSALVAPGYTPRLISADTRRRCLILQYVRGKTFQENTDVEDQEVRRAIEFIGHLNRDRRKADGIIRNMAADGYLSISEHLKNIGGRISSMEVEHLPRSYSESAGRLLSLLQREFEKTLEYTNKRIRLGAVEDKIGAEEMCVSPSDFGFHNAIRTVDGVVFIDFEFAGWDDPAKMIVDFELQPRVPVLSSKMKLIKALSWASQESVVERCKIMLPILGLKWLCIILSVFQPRRLEEILETDDMQDCTLLIDKRINDSQSYILRVNNYFEMCRIDDRFTVI